MIALEADNAMSPDTFSIRPADLHDAPELSRLAAELGYVASAEAMRQRLHWLEGRDDAVLVAAAAGAPLLGWIHLGRRIALESGECAEILGLVVGATARRLGVGKRLVTAAEAWSRNRGLDRIVVRSNAARTESHRFYPALDYALAKSQHVYQKRLTAGE